jgi:hypothetical protein
MAHRVLENGVHPKIVSDALVTDRRDHVGYLLTRPAQHESRTAADAIDAVFEG